MLIGYSQGADILPFVVNRLPAATRSDVRLAAMLGLGERAVFEFHLANWLSQSDDGLPIAPELQRMSKVRALCIYNDGATTQPVPGRSEQHAARGKLAWRSSFRRRLRSRRRADPGAAALTWHRAVGKLARLTGARSRSVVRNPAAASLECGATRKDAGSITSSTSNGWRCWIACAAAACRSRSCASTAPMVRKGSASLRERQQLLRTHRRLIEQRIADLAAGARNRRRQDRVLREVAEHRRATTASLPGVEAVVVVRRRKQKPPPDSQRAAARVPRIKVGGSSASRQYRWAWRRPRASSRYVPAASRRRASAFRYPMPCARRSC